MSPSALPIPPALQQAMADTPQNPRYHAEGSVLAHTALVLEKYKALSPDFDLTPDDHEVLYWASILHDIGKVRASRLEQGRWRATGHERAGVPMALDILMGRPEISGPQRRRILDLVRWHGFPLPYMREQRPLDALKLLGTRTDLRLLSIFSLFDFHGRICADGDWVLESIQRFHGVEVPKAEYEFAPFATLQTAYAGWNLRHKNAVWSAIRMEQPALLAKLIGAAPIEAPDTLGKKVIVPIGPPRSGKTTYAETQLPNVHRIDMWEHGLSFDHLRKADKFYMDRKLVEFKHYLVIYLNRFRRVYLDGENLHEGFRLRLNEIIRGLGVEIEYVVFEAGLDALHARNATAAEPMSETELDARYREIDLVHPWEAHKVDYIGSL